MLEESIHAHAEAGTLGNYRNNVFVVGGYDDVDKRHKKTEIFDLTNKVWTETTEFPFGDR